MDASVNDTVQGGDGQWNAGDFNEKPARRMEWSWAINMICWYFRGGAVGCAVVTNTGGNIEAVLKVNNNNSLASARHSRSGV